MTAKFCWYDLNTKDFDKASAFYTGLFGWNLIPWVPEGAPEGAKTYTMIAIGEKPFGGIVPMGDEIPAPSHWMGHIAVPDVDAAVERAKAGGAQFPGGIVDVPTVGRFAPMIDPEGAVCSLFTPEGEMDDSGYSLTPGRVGWNELAVADPKPIMQFYTDVVGWKWSKGPSTEMDYYLFGSNDERGDAGGMMQRTPETPMSSWMLYFTVADCDASLTKAAELGATTLAPAFDVPGVGRMAVVASPDGAVFGIAEWRMEGM